jgi:hypothetical protein
MLITRKVLVNSMPLTFFIAGITDLYNYFAYYHIGALISSIVMFLLALGIPPTLFFLRRNNPRFTQWLHADMLHSNDQ